MADPGFIAHWDQMLALARDAKREVDTQRAVALTTLHDQFGTPLSLNDHGQLEVTEQQLAMIRSDYLSLKPATPMEQLAGIPFVVVPTPHSPHPDEENR